jgi:ribonuclease D
MRPAPLTHEQLTYAAANPLLADLIRACLRADATRDAAWDEVEDAINSLPDLVSDYMAECRESLAYEREGSWDWPERAA